MTSDGVMDVAGGRDRDRGRETGTTMGLGNREDMINQWLVCRHLLSLMSHFSH